MARRKGLSFYTKKKVISSSLVREVFSYIFGIVTTVFIAAVIVYMLGITTGVIGNSMEPSLYSGQTVYINKLSYLFGQPKAGDIVVFLPNGNVNSHYYVKRVVGTPGDTVQIVNGKLMINDKEFTDEIKRDKISDPGIASERITLSGDEFFVLGDNTNNSEDSRSANIGIVKKEYIIGKAWFKNATAGSKMGFVG
ncbi:MAG: signal peptidase I [Lachnospiraceae bacterium]|nr:signal peptidase I [Lachnospiraceae bacterium]MBR4992871.1 signal peptidase I [Lachnospiraceae bacterium]MBR5945380.1 signal peptidase I [Lachnospiraceae bacterium]